MGKSATKNEDAVVYNEELANLAEELAVRLEDEDVKKWCAAVAKQHRFHERRHRKALARRAEKNVEEEMSETNISEVHEAEPSVEEQQKIFAETFEDREVSRDAGSGQFVSHEYADENPETTVTETVEVKRVAHAHHHQLPCGPGCPAYNENEVNA